MGTMLGGVFTAPGWGLVGTRVALALTVTNYKAVSFLPNDPTLNDHLGDAYWKSGRFEEAKSQWERVLIIDPKFKTKDIVKKKIEFGI